jgi:hypothetical protein
VTLKPDPERGLSIPAPVIARASDNPVNVTVSDISATVADTGCPAFAGHDEEVYFSTESSFVRARRCLIAISPRRYQTCGGDTPL